MSKPVLISTGVSDLEDISEMINLLKKIKTKKFLFFIVDHYIQQI